LSVALVTVTLSSFSQSVIDTMSQEVCKCMEAVKILSIEDNEKIIAEATKCMLEAYATHEAEVSAQLGITEFNGETGRILGQKIGLKMATYCPDYLMKMGTAAQGNPVKESTYRLIGKIQSIEQGEFISYKLKDNEQSS